MKILNYKLLCHNFFSTIGFNPCFNFKGKDIAIAFLITACGTFTTNEIIDEDTDQQVHVQNKFLKYIFFLILD